MTWMARRTLTGPDQLRVKIGERVDFVPRNTRGRVAPETTANLNIAGETHDEAFLKQIYVAEDFFYARTWTQTGVTTSPDVDIAK